MLLGSKPTFMHTLRRSEESCSRAVRAFGCGTSLEKSFPNRTVLNRGFGGSNYSELACWSIGSSCRTNPGIVALDRATTISPEARAPSRWWPIIATWSARSCAKLPETRIVTISIKPSIQRRKLIDKMCAANKLIQHAAAADPRQVFIDVERAMLGADGQPCAELFQADGLHLNEAGYKVWTTLVEPHLKLQP